MDTERVSTDTRTLRRGDVFFALKGERFDGHDFIVQALEKGASSIVYSDSSRLPDNKPDAAFIRVEDTLKAYGDRAAALRRKSRACVVAITGSSGKTTVKEMLAHVLAARFVIHKNQGTENNFIGVPKTILGLEPRHDALVLEMGTNQPGEIARLSEIARPDIAVVTRVAPSHLQGLGSIEGVRDEKLSIVRGLAETGALWLNGDDPILAAACLPTGRRGLGASKVRSIGIKNRGADLRAEFLATDGEEILFRVDGKNFRVPCLGRHNALNALLVIGIARGFGMDDTRIARALADFRPVEGRLSVRRVGEFIFLDDTYNANPASFEAALDALAAFPTTGRRFVVAGDMLELGAQSEELHRKLGSGVAEHGIDFLISAGVHVRAAANEAVKAGLSIQCVRSCRDATEAGSLLRELLKPGEVVLVKGSRGMKMEKVFECF